MTVSRNLRSYVALQAKRAMGMKPLKSKTNFAKAKRMAVLAKKLAPVYQGGHPGTIPGLVRDNIFTIKSNTGKQGWSVMSMFPGEFKANLWANQTASHTGQYDTFAPRMKWNQGLPTPYGTGPANYSAQPGFFDRARVLARLQGANIAKVEMRNMLAGDVR